MAGMIFILSKVEGFPPEADPPKAEKSLIFTEGNEVNEKGPEYFIAFAALCEKAFLNRSERRRTLCYLSDLMWKFFS